MSQTDPDSNDDWQTWPATFTFMYYYVVERGFKNDAAENMHCSYSFYSFKTHLHSFREVFEKRKNS